MFSDTACQIDCSICHTPFALRRKSSCQKNERIIVFFNLIGKESSYRIELKKPLKKIPPGLSHALLSALHICIRTPAKMPAGICSPSSIQTLLSAPESPRALRGAHRIMPRQLWLTQARGLYHRLGISPDPEELLPFYQSIRFLAAVNIQVRCIPIVIYRRLDFKRFLCRKRFFQPFVFRVGNFKDAPVALF